MLDIKLRSPSPPSCTSCVIPRTLRIVPTQSTDTSRTYLGYQETSASGTHLPSTYLVKNLRRKVVAIGRIDKEVALSDETYNIVLDNIYEPQKNLYDRDEKFEDVRIGDLISWPKGFVEFIGAWRQFVIVSL